MATAWRYVNETVELLAAHATKLRKTVRGAQKAGRAYVVVDGTLIPIERVAAEETRRQVRRRSHAATRRRRA